MDVQYVVLRVHANFNATVAQLVEYDLAKVGVAGSSPVCRSFLYFVRVSGFRKPAFVYINKKGF